VRWDSIAKIHAIAAVRRLSLWLLVLPLLARLVNSKPVAKLGWNIDLPFTWGLLYVAGLMFVLSTVTYSLRCPDVIKDYAGWYDYRDREGSYEKLISLLTKVLRSLGRDARFEYLQRRFELEQIRPVDDKGGEIPKVRWRELSDDPNKMEDALKRSEAQPATIPDVYASARQTAQFIRPFSRWLIAALQVTALLLILILLFENSMAVVDYYYPNSTAATWWRNFEWR
jgi:hypothetical protein